MDPGVQASSGRLHHLGLLRRTNDTLYSPVYCIYALYCIFFDCYIHSFDNSSFLTFSLQLSETEIMPLRKKIKFLDRSFSFSLLIKKYL